MHPYAVDSHERRNIIFFLAIFSLILARFLRDITSWNNLISEIVFVVDVISPMAIFSLLYAISDKWLWKWSIFCRLGLIKTPNLNGKWAGTLKSSYDGFNIPHEITVNINQTWSHISIKLKIKTSQSKSQMASLLTSDPKEATLIYHYSNDPNYSSIETMNTHIGTARLDFDLLNNLTGRYYTGRDRKGNFGEIKLDRISSTSD
jgi:predicted pore-forming effector associated with SMODS systems